MYNLEAYLFNKGYLLFHFYNFMDSCYLTTLIILVFGFGFLITGMGFVFFEDHKKRTRFVEHMILLLIFDGLIVHNPVIEEYEMKSMEIKHLLLDIMIIFSLLMVVGYRSDDIKEGQSYDQQSTSSKHKMTPFDQNLKQLCIKVVPDLSKLLKFNKIKDHEKLILKELSFYTLTTSSSKQPKISEKWPKALNKEQLINLQIALNLEKILLIELGLNSFKQNNSNADSSIVDNMEKISLKEKTNTIKILKKFFQSLQLQYEMMRLEYEDSNMTLKTELQNQDVVQIDPTQKFNALIRDFVIEPFGKLLNADIIQIFNELDFPDKIIQELKQINQCTPRRNSRKPQTPVKIIKEEIVPLNLNSSFLSQIPSQTSGKKSATKLKIKDTAIQTKVQGMTNIQDNDNNNNLLSKRVSTSSFQLEQKILNQMNQQAITKRQNHIIRQSLSQIPSSFNDEMQSQNQIIQLQSQSNFNDSQNDASSRYLQSSLQSTQFQTANQKYQRQSGQSFNDYPKSQSAKEVVEVTDPIKQLDLIQMENLSQIPFQTQQDEITKKSSVILQMSLSNGGLTQAQENDVEQQKKQVEQLFKQSSMNSGYQSQMQHKKRTFMTQVSNNYKTQKPKLNKVGGKNFIIKAEQTGNQNQQQSKSSIMNMVSKATTYKYKYTRTKHSNQSSKLNTPNNPEDKNQSQFQLTTASQKKLNFADDEFSQSQFSNDDIKIDESSDLLQLLQDTAGSSKNKQQVI
ncbi:UNKNOWN [Stylonychia lemnae]|uniref:Uncharacterized protein n=1 Tax=Stylonychia lemnae TaxID=5949 RepID=A0A078AUU9_STYLE|nr:UNKNOWN [Stylonychia lemnae]|eukprot:CDW85979.1 UNKNOWN [Stylonychia lemnae]